MWHTDDVAKRLNANLNVNSNSSSNLKLGSLNLKFERGAKSKVALDQRNGLDPEYGMMF